MRFYGFLASVTLMALGAADVRAAPLEAAGLAPHKALYDVRMTSARSASQILNITGQMMYETQPTCDAWASKHKFNLTYEYADTPPVRIASDFSTFEPFDGASMNFYSQRRRDGGVFEDLRGQANLDSAGKGEAVYTAPSGLTFDLPPGSLFPAMHTVNVLNAIREGKKFYNAVVFDGSDQDGPIQISAVLGPSASAADYKSNKNVDVKLLGSPAHKVRLAFFPLKDQSESADYEMDAVLHDNGIISDMTIEYGDFTITQKLVALQSLPDPCAAMRAPK